MTGDCISHHGMLFSLFQDEQDKIRKKKYLDFLDILLEAKVRIELIPVLIKSSVLGVK